MLKSDRSPIYIALSLIIACILTIPVSIHKAGDPFIAFVYAISKKIFSKGSLDLPGPSATATASWSTDTPLINYPAASFLLVEFCSVTAIRLETAVYLPLFGIPMIFLVYLLGLKLAGFRISAVYVIAYSLSTAYNLLTPTHHALGFIGHALVLLLMHRILTKNYDHSTFCLLLIATTLSAMSYYSASLFNMSFLIASALSANLLKKFFPDIQIKSRHLGTFAAFSMIMYFTFDSRFYSLLPLVDRIPPTLHSFLRWQLFGGPPQERVLFSPPKNLFRSATSVVTDIILVEIPTFYFLYALAKLLLKRQKVLQVTDEILFFALVTTGITETIAYATQTVVTSRYFRFFIFPFALRIVFRTIDKLRRQKIGSLCVLTVMMILLFTLYDLFYGSIFFDNYGSIKSEVFHYSNTATVFCSKYFQSGAVVSDHQLSAIAFMKIVEQNKSDNISVWTLWRDAYPLYSSLTQGNGSCLSTIFKTKQYNILILLKLFESKAIYGDFGGFMIPPLGNSIHNLNNFQSFNKVYDSSLSYVYFYPSF